MFNPNPYDEIALVPLNLLHLNQPQQQQQPVRHCALARMLQGVGLDEPANEDDVAIPEEWIVEREHRYYHLGNLLLNLLTQTAAQDPFDRQAYNEQALRLFAQRIGVDEDSFLNIWIFSSDISPETVPTHVHPDIQGRLRTDYRFYSLYRLLIDANNHFSNNMLNFLTTNDAWRPQIWAEEFPNFPYSQGTQLSPELQQMAQELDGQQGF